MRGAVYVNGTITPADAAVIPVFDHGFLYGEGVYESCAPTTACRFSSIDTSAACALGGAISTWTCRSTTTTLRSWIDETVAAAGARGRHLHPHPAHARRRRADLRRRATPAPSVVIIVKPHDGVPARVCSRRHPHLARADPAQPSRLGEPDHQVEQPAEQRAGDAGGAPPRRRRSADVQLPRRAVGVLAVELLHRARRRRA